MTSAFEISDRYLAPGDADGLLYEPLGGGYTYRKTRRYLFDYEGKAEDLEDFVRTTLFDEVSQELHPEGSLEKKGKKTEKPSEKEEVKDAGEIFEDAAFVLDYGMKPGALDLEKEAVLEDFHSKRKKTFDLKNLTVRQRIYVFAPESGSDDSPGPADEDVSDRFVRDICNPAIHHWKVIRPD